MVTRSAHGIALNDVIGHVGDLRGLLEVGSPSERREVLASFVEEVVRGGSEATLRYKLPAPPTAVAVETPAVLDTVLFGGAGGIRTPYLFNAIEALSRLSYSPGPRKS